MDSSNPEKDKKLTEAEKEIITKLRSLSEEKRKEIFKDILKIQVKDEI